jgi:hypothetical protein
MALSTDELTLLIYMATSSNSTFLDSTPSNFTIDAHDPDLNSIFPPRFLEVRRRWHIERVIVNRMVWALQRKACELDESLPPLPERFYHVEGESPRLSELKTALNKYQEIHTEKEKDYEYMDYLLK